MVTASGTLISPRGSACTAFRHATIVVRPTFQSSAKLVGEWRDDSSLSSIADKKRLAMSFASGSTAPPCAGVGTLTYCR